MGGYSGAFSASSSNSVGAQNRSGGITINRGIDKMTLFVIAGLAALWLVLKK
jgi:hypothetical protein